jgi:hypothetical protein
MEGRSREILRLGEQILMRCSEVLASIIVNNKGHENEAFVTPIKVKCFHG